MSVRVARSFVPMVKCLESSFEDEDLYKELLKHAKRSKRIYNRLYQFKYDTPGLKLSSQGSSEVRRMGHSTFDIFLALTSVRRFCDDQKIKEELGVESFLNIWKLDSLDFAIFSGVPSSINTVFPFLVKSEDGSELRNLFKWVSHSFSEPLFQASAVSKAIAPAIISFILKELGYKKTLSIILLCSDISVEVKDLAFYQKNKIQGNKFWGRDERKWSNSIEKSTSNLEDFMKLIKMIKEDTQNDYPLEWHFASLL